MEAQMPRVLMVHGYPMSDLDNATSQTLKNLFADWNPDHIAQIICRDAPVSGDRIFHMSPGNITGIDLYRKIRGRPTRGIQYSAAVPGAVELGSKKIMRTLWDLAVAYSEVLPYRLSDELNTFVTNFCPDVIYTLLGNYRITKLVNDLAKLHHVPIVPHFMDDWLATRYSGNLVFRPLRAVIMHALNNLMADVSEGLAISNVMAEEYYSLFKVPMKSLMNCVDIPSSEHNPCGFFLKDPLIITYAGGLHLLRWESALGVAKAVEVMRSTGLSIEFHIFTSDRDRDQFSKMFLSYTGTRFNRYISQNELKRIYQHSFLLVHLESFNPVASNYTRLSISTKIPEYLVAGKPILAIGPRGIASIEHILSTGSGIWASGGVGSVVKVITDLLESRDNYLKYCDSSFKAAIEHHSSKFQRERLSRVLLGASYPIR